MTNKETEQIQSAEESQSLETVPAQKKTYPKKVRRVKSVSEQWYELKDKINTAKTELKQLHLTQIKEYNKLKGMLITPWRNRKHTFIADINSRLDKRKRSITLKTFEYRKLKEQRYQLWFIKNADKTNKLNEKIADKYVEINNVIYFPTFHRAKQAISNIFTKFLPTENRELTKWN